MEFRRVLFRSRNDDLRPRRGQLREQHGPRAGVGGAGLPRRLPRGARRPRLDDVAARTRRAPRAAPADGVAMTTHLIGLLLGTEDDWSTAFEHVVARVGPFDWRGERHELAVERISHEPFDL